MVRRTAALAIVGLMLAASRAATQEPPPIATETACWLKSLNPSATAAIDEGFLVECSSPARPIRIELLDVNFQDPPRVVTSREGSTVDQLSIPQTSLTGKYLRVFRGSSAPLTMPVSSLRTQSSKLSPAIPGGELFVMLEPATVAPDKFEFRGAANLTIAPDRDPAFAVIGRPGRYSIRPLYTGGRTGAVIDIDVADGKTTDLVFRKESLGAADIVAEGLQCQFMDGIRVWREDDTNRVTDEKTYAVNRDTCGWRIAGLPLGWYLVSAVARGGRGTIMTFEIVEQKVTQVSIAEPPVRVTGRLTLKGLPVADAPILVTTARERELGLRTDTNGEFAAALPTPGTYTLLLYQPERFAFHAVTLHVGDNYVDWALDSKGTIRVTAEGFDLESTITITIKGTPSKDVHRRPLRPGAELTVAGLNFGTYVVTASQRTLRSKPIEVKLDERNGSRAITVRPQ